MELKRIKKILKNPRLLFLTLGHRELFNWIDDERYLKIAYWCAMKKKLNLTNPQTFNEKLQYLKLHDRNPLYTSLADKYDAKIKVGKIIGEEYIIPTIGVWDRFDEIEFDKLPNQFVLKCTHDSGGVIICKNKNSLDIDAAKNKINRCLKHSFFWSQREWPYKNIKPRIIAEPYMEDSDTHDLRDYKYLCFNGEPKIMFIATERQSSIDTRFDYFDMEFNHLPFTWVYDNATVIPEPPKNFQLMKELAAKVSEKLPHVRVDFYEVNGHVYFGEVTFYHQSGMAPLTPEEWDYKLGKWIDLP